MENENVEWKIKNAPERQILKEGRYECELIEVKAVNVPSFDDKEKLEQKIVFVFEPTKVQADEGKEITITKFCSPSMNKKSKMLELLSQMSNSGKVPATALKDGSTYKAYAESFVGKLFMVGTEPSTSGKYNNLTSIYPAKNDGQVTIENDEIPF